MSKIDGREVENPFMLLETYKVLWSNSAFFLRSDPRRYKKCTSYLHTCTGVSSIFAHSLVISCWFQSTSDAVIRRAAMMSDMHIRNLRQKSLLKQRTEEAVKKLQVWVTCMSNCSFKPLNSSTPLKIYYIKINIVAKRKHVLQTLTEVGSSEYLTIIEIYITMLKVLFTIEQLP